MNIASPISGQLGIQQRLIKPHNQHENPVVETSKYVLSKIDIVKLNEEAISNAASYIRKRLIAESHTPWSWRTHPLHLCPPDTYSHSDPRTKASLDWIFLVSSLNFSFWSEYENEDERYGVEWRAGWGREDRKTWTGYWSLLAALNKALDEGVPVTDPMFYSSETRCPDHVIAHIFKAAPRCSEGIPLLKQRISIMRENGTILCQKYGGSFQGFMNEFLRAYNGKGTALQLVQMITEAFPSFRDELSFDGRQVMFWKRAQILVAETWAAFHPDPISDTISSSPLSSKRPSQRQRLSSHPFFPNGVGQLTMFADYRVPQILHHFGILTYPPSLVKLLKEHTPVPHGSREELSIRAASILAVEGVRDEIARMEKESGEKCMVEVTSVLIDFYLWDLAKRIESGDDVIGGVDTKEMLPTHRTRSIWY